jgi:hypothetical protein
VARCGAKFGLVGAADLESVERSESRGRAALLTADRLGGVAGSLRERQRAFDANWRVSCKPQVTCCFVVMLPRVFPEGNIHGREGPSLLGGSWTGCSITQRSHMAPEAAERVTVRWDVHAGRCEVWYVPRCGACLACVAVRSHNGMCRGAEPRIFHLMACLKIEAWNEGALLRP